MFIWNFLSEKCKLKLAEKNSTYLGLCITFVFLFVAFFSNKAKAIDALCYIISSDGETTSLEDICREVEEGMPEEEQNSPIEQHYSEEELEEWSNIFKERYKNGEFASGSITVSDGNSIAERVSAAAPGEVISLSDDPSYPDGTYVQDKNIHYSDGTVVENAFIYDEETRIVLPDGSTLMPGESHQISENHIIDIQTLDE